MADQEENKQPSLIDEETLESIQDTLYNRLREPLLLELRERLIEQAAEQPIPLYYDRFIAGQTQRLEEAIDRNTQRILELREEMGQRFEEMDRRFTEAKEGREALRVEMDHRFTELQKGLDWRFETIDQRFEAMDQRFETIDQRFETMDRRFEAMDRRFEAVDGRFEAMDAKLDQQNVHMRNWTLAAVALMSLIVAILQLVLK